MIASNNSRSGNEDQYGQASSQSSKKNFHLNKRGQQSQSFKNTPVIDVNTTVVKKYRKQGNRDLS